jgi:hypothetical protein
MMRPAWDATMTSMAASPKKKPEFAEIESQHLDSIKSSSKPLYDSLMSTGRVSYPTILMFENGKASRYDKPRDQKTFTDTFSKFAAKPTPAKKATPTPVKKPVVKPTPIKRKPKVT